MHYLKRYWLLMALSILFAGLTVAMTLYIPILVGRAVDLIVGPGAVDLRGIARILKEGCVIILATALLQWLMNMINNKITYQVVRDVRNEAFEKIRSCRSVIWTGTPVRGSGQPDPSRMWISSPTDSSWASHSFLPERRRSWGPLVFMLTINVWITLLVVVLTPLSLICGENSLPRTPTICSACSRRREREQTGPDRRDDRQPEGGAGIRHGREDPGAV